MRALSISERSHFAESFRCASLRAGLAMGAALTTLALGAGRAEAYLVTVGGVQYDVTTFTGSYSNNSALLNSQPWFGDGGLAGTFANEVGSNLGTPNTGIHGTPASEGPYFAFTTTPNFAFFRGTAVEFQDIPANEPQHTWAKVSAVPGPLPLFGAGAAFGFSRRMKRRIQLPRPQGTAVAEG